MRVQEMQELLHDLAEAMRSSGVDEVELDPQGNVVRVKLGTDPTVPSYEANQHQHTGPVTPPRRPTGGLIPRGDGSEPT